MRSNPLQFLTERQIKLLAQQEGISVSQLLARYDRLRARAPKAKKPSAKRSSAMRSGARGRRLNPAQNAGLVKGQSLMAEAAEAYHNGQYDSMPEALSGVAAERRSNPYGRYR